MEKKIPGTYLSLLSAGAKSPGPCTKINIVLVTLLIKKQKAINLKKLRQFADITQSFLPQYFSHC